MSRDDGFAIADVDTSLPADPKIVALARALGGGERTLAALGLYEALRLASWRLGERVTIDEALPAWFLDDPGELVAALIAVRLVDAEGRIPERAWTGWFGPALERRLKNDFPRVVGGLVSTGMVKDDAIEEARRRQADSRTRLLGPAYKSTSVRPSVHQAGRPAQPAEPASESLSNGGKGGTGEDWLRLWLRIQGRPPTIKQKKVIVWYLEKFSPQDLAAIFDLFPENPIGEIKRQLNEPQRGSGGEPRGWHPRPLPDDGTRQLYEALVAKDAAEAAATDRDPDGPPKGPAIEPPVDADDGPAPTEVPTDAELEVVATAQAAHGDPPICDECGRQKVQVGDTDRWICTYWPGHVKPTPSPAPPVSARPIFEEASV